MPQQSSQNNRRCRWRGREEEPQLCQRPGDQALPEVLKCEGTAWSEAFSLFFFCFLSSSRDNVMCLGNLLVLLISSSDIWIKYTLSNYAYFSFSKSTGAIQFNNLCFFVFFRPVTVTQQQNASYLAWIRWKKKKPRTRLGTWLIYTRAG